MAFGTSVDLTSNTGGIVTPNPFWLASAPPANSGAQIMRAFDAGWGGAVWKTLGTPIQNVSSRFGALHFKGTRAIGFNNIELITDRPLEVNFREIAEVKKRYPKHGVIVSLMVETRDEWRDMIKRAIDAGADGLELNFGCPHGMCERGMGSAVGQEPALNEKITSWAVEFSTVPVLVKLTPNVDEINPHGLAAKRGGAHGVSLINTIKSLIGIDIDRFVPEPRVSGLSTNGGYCGAAVKPIAMHMIGSLARDPDFGLPISGIGGVANWRDAVEFILLGCSSVQVCTEVMLRGYRVVGDMIEGLTEYMRSHGFSTIEEMRGKAVPQFSEWGELDLNYETVAKIDPGKCIGCHACVVACHDGAHQCIHPAPKEAGTRVPVVDESECVGCNLCQIVCPVPDCITMAAVDNGFKPATWNEFVSEGKPLRPKKGAH
ncbi:NAD-dependent dihydropyrimidine dehydrogenase subunit PreA [Nannocystis sp. ILAH1]|uniref:NAD-dependent dihydropyrimidine dehydrogenase subunit PreA n=1 Tax=unclassified Nannocystis TaxID=2627009 RepID=UPI00226E1162|nr:MULTISPECIES: NAD-dependent dihydropyrimidine dehydrogenase subunit PreA [unclassified Nannocystis]MCY0993867.1 NAD-dependent dihydropyrimidine dehydrogenase subunit PreA [Nannocystis sp. ILAH1]MCY1065769.1 NAD-dependent dihydropyrimidine dehydrogenase subunit PreA [Nannocystis sp. RBIL2]